MAWQRLLVIVNGKASQAAEFIGPAIAALFEAGFDFDLRQPANAEEMRATVLEAGPAADAIVVAGGDGTINAALPAVIEIGRPLGIVPAGTANDLALTLGIPPEPIAAAAVIARGARRRVDVGRVNGVPFLNAASIGLAVQVAERQQAERKQTWGVLSYVLTTLEVLSEADRFHAIIDCDGVRHEVETYQIAVGNGVYYGGGMTVAQGAEIDDGLLDVYAIETRSIADLVVLGPAIRAGTHGNSPDVSAFRCRRVRIETDRPAPINTDGELTTETPAEFDVIRNALEVIVPD